MSGAAEDEDTARYKARVGTTIRGKWRIESLIGVGGMAAVYAATHRIGRRDAIKILHPEVAVSRELRQRFEQEALAISKLGHPGTVQVLDIDTTEEGSPFLVMEFLEGENLGQRAYRLGDIPEAELLGYVDALLDVLRAAHEQGIVHRDIKPDNLFVTHDGRLKVLDFGIARMKQGGSGLKTRAGAMMGTTSYMAPEQIHGREVDGRADLYATGATVFRIVAKRRIHEATTDAELLVKMGTSPAPPLASVAPGVSLGVARIVDCALAFQLERRYPDAATMQADVRAVLRGEDPPYATSRAVHGESATRAATPGAGAAVAALAAVPAAPAAAFEPTAATAAAPVGPAHATLPANEPSRVVEAALAPAPAAPPRRDKGRPPIGVVVAVGAATLLVGVAISALYMLRGGEASAGTARGARQDAQQDEADSPADGDEGEAPVIDVSQASGATSSTPTSAVAGAGAATQPTGTAASRPAVTSTAVAAPTTSPTSKPTASPSRGRDDRDDDRKGKGSDKGKGKGKEKEKEKKKGKGK